MPLSASKSGSLWTSVALRRCAVAATNASANDTLCAAFNLAASPQSVSSECSHSIGQAFILASAAAASEALRSWVVMYSTSVSVANERWMTLRPSYASTRYDSTTSAPASSSRNAKHADVSKTNASATPTVLRPTGEQGFG